MGREEVPGLFLHLAALEKGGRFFKRRLEMGKSRTRAEKGPPRGQSRRDELASRRKDGRW